MEEDTGNGVEVVAKVESLDTVASSETSPKRGRRRTTKTLSAADALQILQESLKMAQGAGLGVKHGPIPNEEATIYGIVLFGVFFCDRCNNLYLDKQCPYCV